jgi:hypothetical protein
MKSELEFQNRIGRFFGSDNLHWVLVQEKLPTFDYLKNPLDIEDPDKVNQRNLQAIAVIVEQVRLYRRYDIKARYWPDFPTLQVGMPSMFSNVQVKNADGTTSSKFQVFNFDTVSASANANWSIDTKGDIGRQLKDYDFEQEIREREIRRQASELIHGLIQVQEGLKLLDRQRQYLAFREKSHTLAMQQARSIDPEKLVKDIMELEEARYQLKRKFADANSIFWLVDESRWPDFILDQYVQADPNSKGKKLRRPNVL